MNRNLMLLCAGAVLIVGLLATGAYMQSQAANSKRKSTAPAEPETPQQAVQADTAPAPVAISPKTAPPPPAEKAVEAIPKKMFGGTIDQASVNPPDNYENLLEDDAQIFRVGKGGNLVGIAVSAFCEGGSGKIQVEIRPTRDHWPTESDSLTLAKATAEVPELVKSLMNVPSNETLKKAMVTVQFSPPLRVHAGDRLAIVIRKPPEKISPVRLATANSESYPAGDRLQRNGPNWWPGMMTGRKYLFATYVVPDGSVAPVLEPDAGPAVSPKPSGDDAGKTRRPDVAWTNSQWQMLPANYTDVTVGPDDRIWLSDAEDHPTKIPAVKKQVEQEFTRAQPQLPGWRPVLFEPSGRVWFSGAPGGWQSDDTLYGYDGKTWIEYSVTKPDSFRGAPAGHGHGHTFGTNLFIDGRCFFVSLGTVHCFDGKEWTTQKFWSPEDSWDEPLLVPEPDGKGILVATPWNAERAWRWRDGKWSPLAMPESLGSKPVYKICPIDSKSAWVDVYDPGAVRITYATSGKSAVNLLELMRNTAGAKREDSISKLKEIGLSLQPLLYHEVEITAGKKPEENAALTKLHAEIVKMTPTPATFGAYTVDRCDPLNTATTGIVLVSVVGIKGPGVTDKAGTLILGPGTKVTFIPGTPAMGLGNQNDSAGNLPAGNNRVWLTGGSFQGTSVSLLDLATGKVLDRLPEKGHHFLYGVTSKGALFAGTAWRNPGDIGAYKIQPSSPETPAEAASEGGVELTTYPVATTFFDAQGNFWYYDKKDGAKYFDGKNWTLVPGSKITSTKRTEGEKSVFAGSGAVLFCERENMHDMGPSVLIVDNKAVQEATLKALIEKHTEAIQKAFGSESYPLQFTRKTAETVIADHDGNIWLVSESREISVYCNGAWLTVENSARDDLWAIGDGTRVLKAPGPFTKNGERNFNLIHIENGAVQSEPFPVDGTRTAFDQLRMDSHHFIWIARGSGTEPNGSYGVISKLFAPQGVVDETPAAEIAFVDPSGNTWTWRPFEMRSIHAQVWRDGKIICELPIPSRDVGPPQFASDRPGSVFLFGKSAIIHFAENPKHPGNYIQDASFPASTGLDVRFSKLGFYVYSGHVFSFPKPPPAKFAD